MEDQPGIPVNPLSYKDAEPILEALGGVESPRDWQGALPFTYHLGPGGVTVHMKLVQDSALRTIWDVVGTIRERTPSGTGWWPVITATPGSTVRWTQTAEPPQCSKTVHGLGALLKQGWKPRRTIVIGSWDAEEEGLIGSTEWVEQHAAELTHAVAYFNTDVAVSGPVFNAAAVPSTEGVRPRGR